MPIHFHSNGKDWQVCHGRFIIAVNHERVQKELISNRKWDCWWWIVDVINTLLKVGPLPIQVLVIINHPHSRPLELCSGKSRKEKVPESKKESWTHRESRGGAVMWISPKQTQREGRRKKKTEGQPETQRSQSHDFSPHGAPQVCLIQSVSWSFSKSCQ